MKHSLRLEDQIVATLRRITRSIDLRSRMLLQVYGLTVPQLTTLEAISRLEPVTAGALAKEVHLGHPTVTGILDRMDRRLLIERTRGEQDRRNVNVRLTAEGRRVLEAAPSLLQDQFHEKLASLEEWERTQILATLQRFADMIDAKKVEPAPVYAGELPDQPIEPVRY